MPNSILPPIRTAFFDPQSGQISWAWIKWFQSIDKAATNAATAFLTDTHARRTLYPPTGYQSGTVFFESDRNWYYEDTGSAWRWLSGLLITTFALLPVDLGTSDVGALAYATDTTSLYLWNGTVWKSTAIPALIDGNALTIQEKRGLKSALPASLAIGQLYYCIDTSELYVGTGASTHKVEADANSIQGVAVSSQVPVAGQLLIATPAGWVPGDPSVSGMAADGAVPLANPVRVAGSGIDGFVHTVRTESDGVLSADPEIKRQLQNIFWMLNDVCLMLLLLRSPVEIKAGKTDFKIFGKATASGDPQI